MPTVCHLFNRVGRNSFQNSVCGAFSLPNPGFNNSKLNGKAQIPIAADKACGAVKPSDTDARVATAKPDLKGKYDFDACHGLRRRRGATGVIVAARARQENIIAEANRAATLHFWFLPAT